MEVKRCLNIPPFEQRAGFLSDLSNLAMRSLIFVLKFNPLAAHNPSRSSPVVVPNVIEDFRLDQLPNLFRIYGNHIQIVYYAGRKLVKVNFINDPSGYILSSGGSSGAYSEPIEALSNQQNTVGK